jgi:hypothetical protein
MLCLLDRMPILMDSESITIEFDDSKSILLLLEAYGIMGGQTCLLTGYACAHSMLCFHRND